MHIAFKKISDDRHALEIQRDTGEREQVICETKSYLVHDFLHFVVESEARLETGFWESLGHGRTLAELNDRSAPPSAYAPEMADIERLVGALSNAVKGRSAAEVVAGLERYATALQTPLPEWLTERFVESVQSRMRALLGRWRATPHGAALELDWPD